MNSNESENRLDGAHSVEVENVRQDDGADTQQASGYAVHKKRVLLGVEVCHVTLCGHRG